MKTLFDIDRGLLLRNAFRTLANTKYKITPLWVAVVDLCGVGSTSANEICRAMGLEPSMKVADFVKLRPDETAHCRDCGDAGVWLSGLCKVCFDIKSGH